MAHGRATGAFDDFEPKAKLLADAAAAASEEELAEELLGLVPKARRIADRYLEVHGKKDADRFEVLLVEEFMNHEIGRAPGTNDAIIAPGVVDLVVRWKGIKVSELSWNYLYTVEPSAVAPLKSGALTRSAKILSSTTEALYRQAIKDNDLDVADYSEELEKFSDAAEEAKYFPRATIPLMHDERVLLGDFVTTANQIVSAHIERDIMGTAPSVVRNLGNHCDWCPFNKLCEAVILGGDAEDIMHQKFVRGKR
jgi:hypothetical protein